MCVYACNHLSTIIIYYYYDYDYDYYYHHHYFLEQFYISTIPKIHVKVKSYARSRLSFNTGTYVHFTSRSSRVMDIGRDTWLILRYRR